MVYQEVTYNKKTCPIDRFLIKKLDNVKHIIKRNWDCVILIDGMERSGKSTLGFTIGWYLSEGKITLNNVASDTDDAIRKCTELPDGSILILDEGSLIFSSKDTMRKEQKQLIKILNVIGQKNMVFIIILPSFFDLNKFVAVSRSRMLLHVYANKQMQRGRYCYFGEKKKKILYEYGKKHFNSYRYPKANFVGAFYDFFPFDNLEEYKNLKKVSLKEALHPEVKIDPKKIALMIERKNIYEIGTRLKKINKDKNLKLNQLEIANIFGLKYNTFKDLMRLQRQRHEHGVDSTGVKEQILF